MKKLRFHEKGFKFARDGRLFSSVQSGAVRAQGEGSKSHPRGKQWLTVYRAPQVFGQKSRLLVLLWSDLP